LKSKFISLVLLIIFLVASISVARAQEVEFTPRKAQLDIPLVEVPFNFSHGFQFPSMRQSLLLSNDYYFFFHKTLEDGFGANNKILGKLTIAVFDIMSGWLPLGDSWLHEEWHRAVMTNHKIGSYNDVYNLPVFSSAIAVSHVRDEDLIRLKQESPADMVRLQSAGIEALIQQNIFIEKEHFFNNVNTFEQVLLWSNILSNTFYINLCGSSEANSVTDTHNNNDGANIPRRDFAGLDCTGWTYDLHRPLEPYAARGVHASGNGINRYRKFSDLRAGEQSYLKMQSSLTLFNFLDPFLLGYESFYAEVPLTKEGIKWNVNTKHFLTSFGHVIDLNIFLRSYERSCLVTWHHYFNGVAYFPGVQVEIVRQALEFDGKTFYFSPAFGGWFQPEGQRFHNSTGKPGGFFGLRTDYPLSETFETYVEFEQKSEGWVAGEVDLEPSFTSILGFTIEL